MPTEKFRNLPAEDYKDPANFVTDFDKLGLGDGSTAAEYAAKQYEKGLRIGGESSRVMICYNGTWSNQYVGGARTTYEVIGYHRNTAELLRGFIDSGVPIYVYRGHMVHAPISADDPERGVRIQ